MIQKYMQNPELLPVICTQIDLAASPAQQKITVPCPLAPKPE